MTTMFWIESRFFCCNYLSVSVAVFTVTLCPVANFMYIAIADLKSLLKGFKLVSDLVFA